MEKTYSPESSTVSGKSPTTPAGEMDRSFFDNSCILDIDNFVKAIAKIKAKGVRPDLIGSIIAHYAATWLPGISDVVLNPDESESFSVTEFLTKKRFFVETIIGIIPPEKDSVPCNFLLRLLRTANVVGAERSYKEDLESKISWQLDQASLEELMIPSFSHTCGTLLDVELVTRLVKKFAGLDYEGVKSGASLVKVAKLVDSYLVEVAVDGDLSLVEFISLAKALPNHARVTEDGLYRAIDTYLKAHPKLQKQEKKRLCELINTKKLSQEASLHAAQNNRLPVRTIIQVLFTEQTKLTRNRHTNVDCNSTSSLLGPNPSSSLYSESSQARCMSKREMNVQNMELKRLREDMEKLKIECDTMQTRLEKLVVVDKKCSSSESSKGFFKWKKSGFMSGLSVSVLDKTNGHDEEFEYENQTPCNNNNMKTKIVKGRTPSRWRSSMS
ncbi:unnamed protein product [Cochlearia groenlandica]